MSGDACELRAFQCDDAAVVRTIHDTAFGGPAEGRLVEELHRRRPHVSEVALVRGAVVGHVLFSRIAVCNTAGDQWDAWSLAPLAVLPFYQQRGIGTRLVQTGLERCRQLHPDLVLVLGDPTYYARFGFEPAPPQGIHPPLAEWAPAFQVLALAEGILKEVAGQAVYPGWFFPM